MIGHLGSRVSALLDGQLSPAEAERAWIHVHGCHLCRDAVEREGWVKTRLSHAAGAAPVAPAHLKGSLLGVDPVTVLGPPAPRPRRTGLLILGGSAAGVAVVGLLTLGLSAGDLPDPQRRGPVTHLGGTELPLPARTSGPLPEPFGSPSR